MRWLFSCHLPSNTRGPGTGEGLCMGRTVRQPVYQRPGIVFISVRGCGGGLVSTIPFLRWVSFRGTRAYLPKHLCLRCNFELTRRVPIPASFYRTQALSSCARQTYGSTLHAHVTGCCFFFACHVVTRYSALFREVLMPRLESLFMPALRLSTLVGVATLQAASPTPWQLLVLATAKPVTSASTSLRTCCTWAKKVLLPSKSLGRPVSYNLSPEIHAASRRVDWTARPTPLSPAGASCRWSVALSSSLCVLPRARQYPSKNPESGSSVQSSETLLGAFLLNKLNPAFFSSLTQGTHNKLVVVPWYPFTLSIEAASAHGKTFSSMAFTLPPLPYDLNALAPHISAETLEFHHGKHHAAYVKKLNELSKGTKFESMPLEVTFRGLIRVPFLQLNDGENPVVEHGSPTLLAEYFFFHGTLTLLLLYFIWTQFPSHCFTRTCSYAEVVIFSRNLLWRCADVIRHSSGPLFNNAAQAWNHTFYFNCMKPPAQGGGKEPQGQLRDALLKKWSSYDKFKEEFSQVAAGHFGSGWAWLNYDTSKKELQIQQTHDAANPLTEKNQVPLLCCDVWEHAYYIDRRNDRGAYIKAWWEVVNWPFAEKNYAAALK